MKPKDFRHTVAQSALTLPFTIVLSGVVCLLPHIKDQSYWLGWGLILLATYFLLELNNRYQLLRIRSRLVCCSFLVLITTFPQLQDLGLEKLPLLCFLGSLFLLFSTYQDRKSQGISFHAFLLIGIASLYFPPMVLLLPLYYIYMGISLRSLTWKSLVAGLLGFTIPYWFYVGYHVWYNQLDTAFNYLLPYLELPHYDYTHLPKLEIINVGFVTLLMLLSLLHYLRTKFNDKIRVRMYFNVFIGLNIFLLVFIGVFPQYYTITFPMFIAISTPLVGHYFALAKGKWLMNIWFIFWLLMWVGMLLLNYNFIPLP